MKIKSIICLTVALISLTVTSCGTKPEQQPASQFFKLTANPTVSFTKQSKEIVGRYNAQYTDKFTPSDSYGEIMPFMGQYLTYTGTTNDGSEKTIVSALYGICTEDGKIIVDPVYKSVKQVKLKNGNCFYIFRVDSKSTTKTDSHIIISHDGTWMSEISGNYEFSELSNEEMIVLLRTVKYKNGDIKYVYEYYDYEGKKSFSYSPLQNDSTTASSTISEFKNGAAAVNETYTDPAGNVTTKGYYVNKKGYSKFGTYTFAGEFSGGYAVVANQEGLYGVIDEKGSYFIKPTYKSITYNAELGYFACINEENCTIMDKSKNTVKVINTVDSVVNIVGAERLMYKKYSKATDKTEYFYLDSNEPFVFTGTGQFPSEHIGNGIYSCSYSNVCYFFNEDGQSILICEDFGGIASSKGNYIVIQNKRKDKLYFIDFKTKTTLSSIEYAYCEGLGDKGLFVVEKDGLYSIYDATTGTFKVENCDLVEIMHSYNKDFFSVKKDGYIELYDDSFNVVFRTLNGGVSE